MSYWPFWLVGLGLAAVPLVHWFWLRKMFAVSGRFTSLVDATLAGGARDEQLSQDDLLAALRDATVTAFGEGAVGASSPAALPAGPGPTTHLDHALFFLSLIGGGAIAHCAAGAPKLSGAGFDPGFARLVGGSPLIALGVLTLGGLLVGFGTRMAGGCTSGHGLCGTSRVQPGSLVATACFFGAGIAVSFLLNVLLGAR